MRFLYNNEIDNYILTFNSENSSYSVDNLQSYQLTKKYRSAVFTDLIDRGNCESTTHPMIFDETVPVLTSATFARDIAEAHAGIYSYKVIKTIASGTAAYVTLCDNEDTDDMHGMVAGHTYTYSAWVYVPSGGIALNEIRIWIEDYVAPTWVGTDSSYPTAFDTWQRLTVTRTIRSGATGATIGIEIISTAENNEYFYIDDIKLYEAEWIIIDAGAGNTITANSVAILAHNLSDDESTFKIQAHEDNTNWNNPDLNETFVYNTDIMIKYFTEASYRFWRFLFIDVNNSDEYIELGRLILCTYLETNTAGRNFSMTYEDSSSVTESLMGQVFGDERIVKRIYKIQFPYWTDALKKSIVIMFKEVRKFKPILLVLDENNVDKILPMYCHISDNLDINHIVSYKWSGILNFKEAF